MTDERWVVTWLDDVRWVVTWLDDAMENLEAFEEVFRSESTALELLQELRMNGVQEVKISKWIRACSIGSSMANQAGTSEANKGS